MSNVSSLTTTNYDNKLDNKNICNAFRCSKGATEKIDVNAGIFGTISLSLCSVCVKKFNGGDEEMRNASPRKSLQVANGGACLI